MTPWGKDFIQALTQARLMLKRGTKGGGLKYRPMRDVVYGQPLSSRFKPLLQHCSASLKGQVSRHFLFLILI